MPPFDHPCHLKLEYLPPPPPPPTRSEVSTSFKTFTGSLVTPWNTAYFAFFPNFSHLFCDSDQFFSGIMSPSYILPSYNICCWSFSNKHTWKNIAFEWKAKFVWVMRGLSSDINYFKNLHCTISRLWGPITVLSLDVQLYHLFLAVSMDIRMQSSLSKIEKSWKGLFFFEHSLSKW